MITLEDKTWMQEIIDRENCHSADYSFVGNYLYQKENQLQVIRLKDRMSIYVDIPAGKYFSFPIGSGDLREAVDFLRAEAGRRGIPFILCAALPQHIEELHAAGINDFRAEELVGADDYVYTAEKLAYLKGKKLSAKRNHINRFLENYSYEYVELTPDNMDQAEVVLEEWLSSCGEITHELQVERELINQCMREFETLNLLGGLIYADGRPVAFSMGSMQTHDTLEIHFEKSHREIQGAYAMINREFVRSVWNKYPDLNYVNREEDMGLEGLRHAKESYHPDLMIRKHNLYFD